MKTFKSITEWLKSNPSEEEQKKVMVLINKGAVNETRREVYELQRYFNKLAVTERYMSKLGLPPNKEVQDKMKEVKAQIDELSKGLPAKLVRAKKVAEVVEK
jgi:hypothetical protein